MIGRRLQMLALATCLLVAAAVAYAGPDGHTASTGSPYSGMEAREIKTLSDDDVRQLLAGEGWGLALAAELNGVPGPLHLLEAVERGEMHLTDDQLARIEALRAGMLSRAVPLGELLVEQERELNLRLAAGDLDEQALLELLQAIAETTAQLRYEHLVTHLRTAAVLSPHQIARYNQIRGYLAGDGAHSDHHHGH